MSKFNLAEYRVARKKRLDDLERKMIAEADAAFNKYQSEVEAGTYEDTHDKSHRYMQIQIKQWNEQGRKDYPDGT